MSDAKKSLYERVRDVDRRVIFLAIALAVILPMLVQWAPPEHPSKMVREVFDKTESLPDKVFSEIKIKQQSCGRIA